MFDFLNGKKTYFVAIATILYAVIAIGWNTGDWEAAFELVLIALGLTTVRHGISKGPKPKGNHDSDYRHH